MDETVSLRRARTKSENWRRNWYPLLLDFDRKSDSCCVYCGCHVRHHRAEALMYAVKAGGRRQRQGISLAHCVRCAVAKRTSQVVCYALPGTFR